LAVNWRIEAVGNFFTNGNIDLVFVNTNGRGATAPGDGRSIWYLTDGVLSGTNKFFPESLSSGIFYGSLNLPMLSTQWRVAGVGDFNGDGEADLVWQTRAPVKLLSGR
jgi:hypothetical protein